MERTALHLSSKFFFFVVVAAATCATCLPPCAKVPLQGSRCSCVSGVSIVVPSATQFQPFRVEELSPDTSSLVLL